MREIMVQPVTEVTEISAPLFLAFLPSLATLQRMKARNNPYSGPVWSLIFHRGKDTAQPVKTAHRAKNPRKSRGSLHSFLWVSHLRKPRCYIPGPKI